MASTPESAGRRATNKAEIMRLMQDRHARKDMLSGLFTEYFKVPATIRCEFADHILYLEPRDTTLTPAILTKGHWNRDELVRAITVLRTRNALAADGLFLDVGANIGTQSIYAMRSEAFAGGHAFEPAPDNINLLERNLTTNGLDGTVKLFRQGVGSASGEAVLHLHPGNQGAHSLSPAAGRTTAGQIEVSMVSLDVHLATVGLAARHVGLLWIDVEGHEPAVIAGAKTLIQARVPVVFEFLKKDIANADVSAMLATLRAHYTDMYRLQDDVSAVQPASELDTSMPEGDYLVFRGDQ